MLGDRQLGGSIRKIQLGFGILPAWHLAFHPLHSSKPNDRSGSIFCTVLKPLKYSDKFIEHLTVNLHHEKKNLDKRR
jgi:hypothetical protein